MYYMGIMEKKMHITILGLGFRVGRECGNIRLHRDSIRILFPDSLLTTKKKSIYQPQFPTLLLWLLKKP